MLLRVVAACRSGDAMLSIVPAVTLCKNARRGMEVGGGTVVIGWSFLE
jgi:hypothetical protein